MISIQSLDVTPEEFLEYSGINLSETIKRYGNGNPSERVESFLRRNRIRLNNWIDSHFGRPIGPQFNDPTDYQKFHYKLALIEQDIYCLRNGDIATDSGLDENYSLRLSRADVEELSLAPEAKRNLILAGLWNANIGARYGFSMRWWWGPIG